MKLDNLWYQNKIRKRIMAELEPIEQSDEEPLPPRPKTRKECATGIRPCPYVGCRHHLYLEVNEFTGSIKFNFPGVEPEDLQESCSLDVATKGGIEHHEIAGLLNTSRQRITQIEEDALKWVKGKIKRLQK